MPNNELWNAIGVELKVHLKAHQVVELLEKLTPEAKAEIVTQLLADDDKLCSIVTDWVLMEDD